MLLMCNSIVNWMAECGWVLLDSVDRREFDTPTKEPLDSSFPDSAFGYLCWLEAANGADEKH